MNEKYVTTDLSLAAALCVSGFNLVDIDRQNPQRCGFIFDSSLELYEATDNYWANKLEIPAYRYATELMSIRTRLLHSKVRNTAIGVPSQQVGKRVTPNKG